MALSAPIVGTPTLVNTGAASGTVVVPATAQAGDRLLLIIAYGGGGIPAVLGAGGVSGGAGGQWPTLPGFPVGGTAPGTALDIRTGICRFNDIGATLTVFFNTATAKAIMWVEAWRDPNGTPEINQSSGKLAATATALTTNSITPSVAGCWVMSVFCNRGLTSGTFTPGTDSGSGGALTERDDQTNTGSSEVAAEVCDTNATVSSGVATVHSSTSSATAAYCAGIVAVAPGSVFPTDQQIISSQLHPGRTPSQVARFRQTPRSTEIAAAAGPSAAGAATGEQRTADVAAGVKGAIGAAQSGSRISGQASGVKGTVGAAQGPTRTADISAAQKQTTAVVVGQQRSSGQPAAKKGGIGAAADQQRSSGIAVKGTPPAAPAVGEQRLGGVSAGKKATSNAGAAQQRAGSATAAVHKAAGAAASQFRIISVAAAVKRALGVAGAQQRTAGLTPPGPKIPPPRWVEHAGGGSGTTDLAGGGVAILERPGGGTGLADRADTGTALDEGAGGGTGIIETSGGV